MFLGVSNHWGFPNAFAPGRGPGRRFPIIRPDGICARPVRAISSFHREYVLLQFSCKAHFQEFVDLVSKGEPQVDKLGAVGFSGT
jgi:hypothetical protein